MPHDETGKWVPKKTDIENEKIERLGLLVDQINEIFVDIDENYDLDMSAHVNYNQWGSSFFRVAKLSKGSNNPDRALIHGENLKVLKALADANPKSVRCAYLDPPYNNGGSYRHYYDNMGHDEWLVNVSQRLEQIQRLLTNDGNVWISIDDSEVHYLKVAADGIFGRDNFVGTIVWERRKSRENRKVLSRNHEYILVYASNKKIWTKARNTLPLSDAVRSRYKNLDNDPRGLWQSVTANAQDGHATANQYYTITSPSGRVHKPPKGRCWVYPQHKMAQEIKENNIWFGVKRNNVPRIKTFLKDRTGGLTPETLWKADEVGTTSSAKKHLLALFHETTLFDTPKPEHLLQKIIHISTNPGDVVLDAYLGSATTVAVAHKMGRGYIGIEVGSHIDSHCRNRLQQVVNGEKGGVSSLLGWQGGGGFDFYKYVEGAQ